MANRSYLYSCDIIPPGAIVANTKMQGISEYKWEIPLVQKILVSSNPVPCKSSIWKNPADLAITADYDPGVQRLKDFMSKIQVSQAQPLIQEAIRFLEDPCNSKKYFVLEAGEICDMLPPPIESHVPKLMEELKNLDQQMQEALTLIEHSSRPKGFLTRFLTGKLRVRQVTPVDACESLGLGDWSNHLYYALTQD
jgi:hypothetical protein